MHVLSVGLLPQGTVPTLSQSLSPAVATVMSTGLPDVQAPQNPTAQFSLSSSFPPLPVKLVSKIRSLQYIDMKELLPDNIGLARSRDASELGALPICITWLPGQNSNEFHHGCQALLFM